MAFIAIEGGEGVGKSTQVKLLEERLPLLFPGTSFLYTREPRNTPLSQKIRELILSDLGKEADGKTIMGLFIAARHDHLRRVIAPALEKGDVVICDRFVGTTYAYQVHAMENNVSETFFDSHFDELSHKPDLTIIFDVAPQVAQLRLSARTTQAMTHFDAQTQAFHEKTREGYLRYSEKVPSVVIDTNREIETIHEDVISAIRNVLKS